MLESKILLLSKCVEQRRYAEMLFYDGILHFGYPSEWIKKAEEGNVGQGDLLEGVTRMSISFGTSSGVGFLGWCVIKNLERSICARGAS